ncbi:MAG: methyltransferase, partial [Acidimicrobiales bacterium]|nr:methyltransferase [Acidimicrobiales bacterium]
MSNTAADRSETNIWRSPELARTYLAMADSVAHRTEGEAALLEVLPERVERVLDLGCGDGRLGAIVRGAHPDAGGLAVDFSEVML